MVKEIKTNQWNEVEKSKVAVVDFAASWCGPCQMLAPVFTQVSEEMGEVDFYHIDIDESPELAEKFNIMTVPSLILMKDGGKVDQKIGFMPKDELVAWVKENQ